MVLRIMLLFVLAVGCRSEPTSKLNVVFIVVDDLGWRDLGVYRNRFHETRNINRLADAGMLFTQAYSSSPMCSPSRASLITGKYPARIGMTHILGPTAWRGSGPMEGPPTIDALPPEEVTLAEAFREAGYATYFVGKPHFDAPIGHLDRHGFDVEFFPWRTASSAGRDVLLVDKALELISSAGEQPFLLCFWTFGVHVPLLPREDLLAKYNAKASRFFRLRPRAGVAEYAAAIEELDQNVGRLLVHLDERGIADRTVVILTSDNGAWPSNQPLRATKGWLYEGGIRVPLIVRWPGKVSPGTKSNEPVIGTDLYPTLLEIAGLPRRPEQHRDGVSLVPLLTGSGELEERGGLYWHFPHYSRRGGRPSGAIRVGPYKLIEFFEDGHLELYNLDQDPPETRSLAELEPERAEAMRQRLADWRGSVGALLPQRGRHGQARGQ